MPSSGASSISARRTHLHSLSDSNHPAAATPTEWQPAPATRVTLFTARQIVSSRPRVSEIHHKPAQPATQSSTTHSKTPTLRALSHSQRRNTAKRNSPRMRIVLSLQKGEQRGHVIIIKPTHIITPTQPHILSTQQRILLREKTTVRLA